MTSPRPIPSDARRSLRLYNACFPIAFLLLFPSYLKRMFRRGNFRAHFRHRFGRYEAGELAALSPHRWTWIQSISVGETLVALKLAHELKRQQPDIHLLLSTTTTTGFALAAAESADWLRPIYNPIDFRWIARRALRLLRPERFIVIEGGVWPNLLAECYRAGVPVALVAARLSPRSERRFRRFKAWIGPIFRLFDFVAVPEPTDVPRWESIGVPMEKTRVTGSIKFDQPATGDHGRANEFRALLTSLGLSPDAPIIVAGSTFPGEESLLAATLRELRQQFPDLFLILVPRHVERTPEVLRELAATGLRVARRSALSDAQKPDILLVDTTGELRDWYRLATIAFIGKSLTAVGGQNPAEPAALGKPVVFGPHMENFAAITDHLLNSGAARQIGSGAELTEAMGRLLTDAPTRQRMSDATRIALAAHDGATRRSAELLLKGG